MSRFYGLRRKNGILKKKGSCTAEHNIAFTSNVQMAANRTRDGGGKQAKDIYPNFFVLSIRKKAAEQKDELRLERGRERKGIVWFEKEKGCWSQRQAGSEENQDGKYEL